MHLKTFGSGIAALVLGGALAGCKDEGGVSVPPPPELKPPEASAGPVTAAAAAAEADARAAKDAAAAEQPLWTCPERKLTNPEKGVAVAVDVAGAAPGMENPIPFFLKLCGDRYDCGIETIQEPGKISAMILKGKSQTDADLLKTWRMGIARSPRLETRVQAWTNYWLDSPSSAPVAIIWYDGITDEDNANGIVDESRFDKLGGVWALPGKLTQNGKATPILLYVLARAGHVDAGAKVAADLSHAAGGATYTVAFDQTDALELFPGTACTGKVSVAVVEPAPELFKGATVRKVTAAGQAELLSAGTPAVLPVPGAVTFAAGKYSDKSAPLEPLALAWAKGPSATGTLPGISVTVSMTGAPPVALPQDAFRPLPDWRWDAPVEAGAKTLSWGFDANNNVSDFRAKLAVVTPCPAEGGGAWTLGVHDALGCRKTVDGIVGPNCGPQTASQLSQVMMNPDVSALLKRPPVDRCAAHILHVPTPDARDRVPVAPSASRSTFTVDAAVSLDQRCAEAILPFDLAPLTLVGEIESKLRVCKTPLLEFFRHSAATPEGSAKDFGTATLAIKGKKVSKLYAWHLLHKFAMALGRASIARIEKHGAKVGEQTRVPLLRVTVDPPPRIPN